MTFAVCVTFEIKPEHAAEFMPLMLANARASLADEAGCLQFDVLTDPAHPGEVFLYELYTDRTAFDRHLSAPHFLAFRDAVAGMIAGKTERTYSKVIQ
jgi:quinol monooxygenase YgiN